MSAGPFLARMAVWVHQRLRAAVDRLAPTELLLAERITGVAATAVPWWRAGSPSGSMTPPARRAS